MMQAIATFRPGAIPIPLHARRAAWTLAAGALACFAASASIAAEPTAIEPDGKSRSIPAAASQEKAAAKQSTPQRNTTPRVRHIGPVTTITEVSTGFPFPARVDTGATTCSIHYEAIEIEDAAESPQDNVGKRVRILIQNPDGEQEWISTKIVDRVTVRTSTDDDERYKVQLKLRWEDVEKKVLVTLCDRQRMTYPVLLGRNFLRGDFLVDVNLGDE